MTDNTAHATQPTGPTHATLQADLVAIFQSDPNWDVVLPKYQAYSEAHYQESCGEDDCGEPFAPAFDYLLERAKEAQADGKMTPADFAEEYLVDDGDDDEEDDEDDEPQGGTLHVEIIMIPMTKEQFLEMLRGGQEASEEDTTGDSGEAGSY